MGLFSKIKKALKFEVFNVKGIIKKIISQPQRLLVGAVDPIGTKLANTVLGTNWKPAVNQLGGATNDTFAAAQAKGMDVGLSKSLHAIAGVVAGIWGGAALGNLAGAGVKSLAAGSNVASSTAAATEAGSVGGDISPVVTTATKVGEAAAPVADTAAQAASGVIEPVATTATKVGTQSTVGGLLSKAATVGKDIYKIASSDAGKTILATALQGYASGKQQQAEQNYQDKYRRAFTPEEMAQMNAGAPSAANNGAPAGGGGYLDRARRVSNFLSERSGPTDPAVVAGYARGEF